MKRTFNDQNNQNDMNDLDYDNNYDPNDNIASEVDSDISISSPAMSITTTDINTDDSPAVTKVTRKRSKKSNIIRIDTKRQL